MQLASVYNIMANVTVAAGDSHVQQTRGSIDVGFAWSPASAHLK